MQDSTNLAALLAGACALAAIAYAVFRLRRALREKAARFGRIAWPEVAAMTWWKRKIKNREINMLRILDDRQIDALAALAEEQAQVDEGLRSSDPARARAAAARMPALQRQTDAALAQTSVYLKRSKRTLWIWNALVIGMVVVIVVLKATRAMH